ncbi:protease inhibitor I42 family protein [Fibrella sp. HMF5335]|uniref:Protease inhibitor I42 family protein n=1 Tax=Fibrella rubiginis TaxID=2817060 RepID=A0A939GIK1_9BACT|nr:protease inhibitor I42 family protein [Fibrella rubiginis]MBO0938473.1 protease inhibitor I42 family protein [Fibrella rubiginis]
MNNQIVYPHFRQLYTLMLASLVALAGACTTSRTGTANGQTMRLSVGDIREVSMTTRADTTWQLTATSDNQEVVDVSRKTTGAGMVSGATGSAAFLIKGVTAGTAKVVFTEKQPGTDGSGRVKKTYVVTVTSK